MMGSARGGPAVLGMGFRPFFLLAGAYAAASTLWWLATYGGAWAPDTGWSPVEWHAHEMLFGFVAAALIGFLLTAVPHWTNSRAVSGWPVGLVATAWLLARAAMWAAGALPPWLVAVVDLSPLVLLIALVAPPIYRSPKRRNHGFPVLLTVLLVADALVHLERLEWTRSTARTGLLLALWTLLLIVGIVAGRVTPAFTANALRRAGRPVEMAPREGLRWAAHAGLVAVAITQLWLADPAVRGVVALAAALPLAGRLAGWHGHRTLGDPIVWILHVAYAWLPVGLALLGIGELVDGVSSSLGLHALTAGAMGTMILAVMTRAGLGHTGRPLHAPPLIVAAYLLVLLGALTRAVGPLVWTGAYLDVLLAGGALWAAGFALFVLVYWPLLTAPRPDGKPG